MADEPQVEARRDTLPWVLAALLAVAATTAVLSSQTADWEPVGLVVALVALNVGSDLLAINVRGLHLSGSFAAIVIAMALLGPAPATVVALAPIVVDAVRNRPPLTHLLSNLATFSTFPLIGGTAVRWLELPARGDLELGALLFVVFMATNFLNFCLIYGYRVVVEGWAWSAGFKDMYAPVVPAQLGIAVITCAVVLAERHIGPEWIIALAPVVIIFQWLLRTAIAAFERGVELEERNRELSALQFGLISSMLRTLNLRDHMTARHSAAVARYSREMASELGLSEEERELIHTAALFHDIGKFIFPDSILLSERRLTDEEFEIVKRHPEVGADVIGEIEGYGEVAKIVRHHHERIDGRGYPDRIAGEEIPLGARILAVADVYDVITARDTYRDPVTTMEAFAELRRVAGTQLDAELVEVFIAMMNNRGIVFRHSTAADFEAELALERRVSDYASPRRKIAA